MRRSARRGLALAAAGSVIVMLAGCAHTEPSRFYTLSSPAGQEQAGRQESGLTISVLKVRVARYLDRDQIVTRPSESEVSVSEFDRWGEPLSEGISRVLAENLSRLLAAGRVYSHMSPVPRPVDFHVAVAVTALDAYPSGRVLLEAQWQVLSGDGKSLIAGRRSSFGESFGGGGDVAAMVSAQSRAVAALSREIADAIEAAPKGKAAER